MSADYTQARLQRIEGHLKSLDGTVSVLSIVEAASVRDRIRATFGSDARLAIVYRGACLQMTQKEIADALRVRQLPGAKQPRVSEALALLEDRGFLRRTEGGVYSVVEGWNQFGLERQLKKTLKEQRIDDLVE